MRSAVRLASLLLALSVAGCLQLSLHPGNPDAGPQTTPSTTPAGGTTDIFGYQCARFIATHPQYVPNASKVSKDWIDVVPTSGIITPASMQMPNGTRIVGAISPGSPVVIVEGSDDTWRVSIDRGAAAPQANSSIESRLSSFFTMLTNNSTLASEYAGAAMANLSLPPLSASNSGPFNTTLPTDWFSHLDAPLLTGERVGELLAAWGPLDPSLAPIPDGYGIGWPQHGLRLAIQVESHVRSASDSQVEVNVTTDAFDDVFVRAHELAPLALGTEGATANANLAAFLDEVQPWATPNPWRENSFQEGCTPFEAFYGPYLYKP
jgi:hypothetical protein